jgi:hypothetical protein
MPHPGKVAGTTAGLFSAAEIPKNILNWGKSNGAEFGSIVEIRKKLAKESSCHFDNSIGNYRFLFSKLRPT